jgi:serine phosphatase RsbU (regulator of sigma subunit)
VLTLFASLMGAAALTTATLAAYVAWRRGSPTGWSLAVLLVAVTWWGLAYAVELSLDTITMRSMWGDLKYFGVLAVPPAWLCFVLQYTGHGRLVTGRLVGALAVEPVLVLFLLAIPATHDLIRFYPEAAAGRDIVSARAGPLFWVNLAYSNALLVGATAFFVTSMARLARSYRRMARIMVAAALLPWVANLLYNFEVGWFAQVDLTPFAFIVTGGILVWGLFRERLVDLTPMARSAVVDRMADGVFVVDAFGRVVDVNPAGARLLGETRATLVGRPMAEVLPEVGDGTELTLVDWPGSRSFDVSRQPLTDELKRPAGELVVLREITERVRDRARLQRVLEEKSRVAAALQASMIPHRLPDVPGCELAQRYEPAGDGSEVGGDFLDVFDLADETWGFLLGDVSGKGAEAAAVSAAARYMLRALADVQDSPSGTLREVNRRLLAATDLERHCTLVYGHVRPNTHGMAVTLSLGGHLPPLVLRATGEVEEVGGLGTVLALFEDPDLWDTDLELAPGEVLCAFTDGLIEARRGGDMFGVSRLAELLAAHVTRPLDELATLIVNEARSFHGGELVDDLALLLVRSRPGEPQA